VLLAGRHPFGFRLDPPPGPYAKNDPLSQLMRLQINTFAFLKGSTEGAGNTHKLIYEARQIVTQNIRTGRFTRLSENSRSHEKRDKSRHRNADISC
jgi:hypothetical protein